jgi:cytochrome c peroxidase
MHNGSYQTLLEVMDFYNKGGGAGIGIHLEHQTLASDPLKLNKKEIADIISFMKSLNNVIRDEWKKPKALPEFEHAAEWNKRVIGGIY